METHGPHLPIQIKVHALTKVPGSRPAPNPLYEDENHKLMSWPSHRWQKTGLIGAVLIGIALLIFVPVLLVKLSAIILACMGTYACIETEFVHSDKEGAQTRVSGIISVSVALFLMGLTAAALAAGVFTAFMTVKTTAYIGKAVIKGR